MKASIDPSLTWYVARSRPGQTIKAASEIRKAGFDAYCPRSRIERWSNRGHVYRMIERPAMPPYIFVGFKPTEKHFGQVSDIEEVGGFLGVDGEPHPVPHSVVLSVLIAETEMLFDDTPASRRARAEHDGIDGRFPVGMAVKLVRDLSSVLSLMDGRVLGTNGRDQVHVAFGAIKSWLPEKDVKAA